MTSVDSSTYLVLPNMEVNECVPFVRNANGPQEPACVRVPQYLRRPSGRSWGSDDCYHWKGSFQDIGASGILLWGGPHKVTLATEATGTNTRGFTHGFFQGETTSTYQVIVYYEYRAQGFNIQPHKIPIPLKGVRTASWYEGVSYGYWRVPNGRVPRCYDTKFITLDTTPQAYYWENYNSFSYRYNASMRSLIDSCNGNTRSISVNSTNRKAYSASADLLLTTGLKPQLLVCAMSDCYSNILTQLQGCTTNSIDNIAQIMGILTSLRRPIQSIYDLAGIGSTMSIGKAAIKDAAQLYLQDKYAVQTSLSDIQSYRDNVKNLEAISSYSAFTKASTTGYDGGVLRCTAYFNSSNYIPTTLIEQLRNFGFSLNLVNTWDMIPYSFVVDWLLGIEPILHTLDQMAIENNTHFKPTKLWWSLTKVESDGSSSYLRWMADTPPPVVYSLWYTEKESSVLSHWMEGSSLIIQRL